MHGATQPGNPVDDSNPDPPESYPLLIMITINY